AAYLILQWPEFYHVRWNFVKGWTTPQTFAVRTPEWTPYGWISRSYHIPGSLGARGTLSHTWRYTDGVLQVPSTYLGARDSSRGRNVSGCGSPAGGAEV